MIAPLEHRVTRYMARVAPSIAGRSGHNALFRAACILVHGYALSPDEALPYLADYNQRADPAWPEWELVRKLNQALTHPGHEKPRGYLLSEHGIEGPLPSHAPLPKAATARPAPNLDLIEQVVKIGPGVAQIRDLSPVKPDENRPIVEEIIDALFPGNPLLCVGKSQREFATRRREVWRGKLSELPLIVPNPMLSLTGRTQDGRTSEHTKEATAARVYQVIEFDFSEKARDGATDTAFTPLVRKWREGGVEIADACAALLSFLSLELHTCAVICHSGGKSLHGWFRVFELSAAQQGVFMNRAVELGADRATWLKSQFVRIPDGLRDNGKRQCVHFFNPQEVVRA